jgi:hypothetical protein
LLTAAIAAAYMRADQHDVAWHLSVNIIIFDSFALGYHVGYPRKREWWKRVIVANVAIIVAGFCYTILAH